MSAIAALPTVGPSPLPEHRKKSDLVYGYLREQILNGTYAPGQRLTLQAVAARTACERDATACVPALRAANDAFSTALRRADLAGMATAIWRFHRAILAASGNDHLAQLLEDLWARCGRFRAGYMLIPGRAEATIAEHARIVAAMEAGDPIAAEAATFGHVDAARIDLERLLADAGAP